MKKDPRRNQLKRWIDHPRIWEDQAGNFHFCLPAILAMVDMPDTPENRAVAQQIATEAILNENPHAKIQFRETAEQ